MTLRSIILGFLVVCSAIAVIAGIVTLLQYIKTPYSGEYVFKNVRPSELITYVGAIAGFFCLWGWAAMGFEDRRNGEKLSVFFEIIGVMMTAIISVIGISAVVIYDRWLHGGVAQGTWSRDSDVSLLLSALYIFILAPIVWLLTTASYRRGIPVASIITVYVVALVIIGVGLFFAFR